MDRAVQSLRSQALTRALEEATRQALRGPLAGGNPRVGCVLLDRDGRQLSAGFHRGAGTAHAEVAALAALPVGTSATGATAVVTLEPCSHVGRTGACVQALLEAGVGRVVYAVADPSPQAGGGAQQLARAGVKVQTARAAGVDAGVVELARRVTGQWRRVIERGRPWLIAKTAMTADGYVAAADGSSQWITGGPARAHAHRVRASVDAIMVGTGTVLADNPRLTARVPAPADPVMAAAARQPLPIIIGKRPLPPSYHLAARSHLLLRTHDLRRALQCAWRHGARRVLLEGGPHLVSAPSAAGLVDEWHCYRAPLLLGDGTRAIGHIGALTLDAALALRVHHRRELGPDTLTVYTCAGAAAGQEGDDRVHRID